MRLTICGSASALALFAWRAGARLLFPSTASPPFAPFPPSYRPSFLSLVSFPARSLRRRVCVCVFSFVVQASRRKRKKESTPLVPASPPPRPFRQPLPNNTDPSPPHRLLLAGSSHTTPSLDSSRWISNQHTPPLLSSTHVSAPSPRSPNTLPAPPLARPRQRTDRPLLASFASPSLIPIDVPVVSTRSKISRACELNIRPPPPP